MKLALGPKANPNHKPDLRGIILDSQRDNLGVLFLMESAPASDALLSFAAKKIAGQIGQRGKYSGHDNPDHAHRDEGQTS